jgi:hypothetical protein
VFLDGRDITDVPTDFSEYEKSALEVVLSDRPRTMRKEPTARE